MTNLDSVVICGEFCNWDIDNAIRVEKKPKAKFIIINNMPEGFFKCFSTKSFLGGEVTQRGEDMNNRYMDIFDKTIKIRFN
ncbi:MAG: hypothetical protein RR454_03125 [Clostridia bacterium]